MVECGAWGSLQNNGDSAALNNIALKLTMFAPNNEAFTKPVTNVSCTAFSDLQDGYSAGINSLDADDFYAVIER